MSKEISIDEVRHMARLSRLVLGEEEEKLLAVQLGSIIGHMNVLNIVPTDGIEPLYSPARHPAFTREDESVNMRSRKEILANAPETDGESFIVPRIV